MSNSSQSSPAHFSWRRLYALCLKETKQITRDPSSALIAIVIPSPYCLFLVTVST